MSFWHLDPRVVHLNHGSFGATPKVVLEAQSQLRDDLEANPTRWFLEQYQPLLDRARIEVADFLGADPAGLGFVTNATAGVNSVLRSLEARLGPGDEIMVTDQNYNACRNAVEVTAARTGSRVVTVALPFPLASPDEIIERITARVTGRTRLLLVDAITSPTALVLPIGELVDQLEPDVEVLVDAAHAPGMIDFNINALAASYVAVNCHKWMCAPKGSGVIYVREDRQDGIYPAVISHGYNGAWPATGGHVHTQFDWVGTDDPTAWLATPDALDAMGGLHANGWSGLMRDNRELCLAGRDMLVDLLEIDPPAPDDMIGAIASVPLPAMPASPAQIFHPLMGTLRHRWNIEVMVMNWVGAEGGLLRISLQEYNTIDDLSRLVEALSFELGR